MNGESLSAKVEIWAVRKKGESRQQQEQVMRWGQVETREV